MKLPEIVSIPEATVTFAEKQSGYRPLPAHRSSGGLVTFCWECEWDLTFRERLSILFRGVFRRRLWHQVMTFNRPLQPQLLLLEKPEMTK